MSEVYEVVSIVVYDRFHSSQWWLECSEGCNHIIEVKSNYKTCTECCKGIIHVMDSNHLNIHRKELAHIIDSK